MSNSKNNFDDEIEDNLTNEEQQKIEEIQKKTFIKEKEQSKEITKPFSIWSIFGFNNNVKLDIDLYAAIGVKQTQVAVPFNMQKVFYLEKSVTINNISGRDAYLILTPAPITYLSSLVVGIGFSGIEASIDASLDKIGEYKVQKVSMTNNTSSRYELDNNKFYCTLYINDGDQWKKSWDNRKFNGRKFDINILEKHVTAALKNDSIPNF